MSIPLVLTVLLYPNYRNQCPLGISCLKKSGASFPLLPIRIIQPTHHLLRVVHPPYSYAQIINRCWTMLGLSAIRRAVAPRCGNIARALSTTESLKVESAATTTPPPTQKKERIKYFKIYRWDPDHQQKPVRLGFIDTYLYFLLNNTHSIILTLSN